MEKSYKEPVTIVDAQSMGASITSGGFNVGGFPYVAIQGAFTTSDAVGTFSVEGSLDGSTWSAIGLSSTPTAASASDNFLIELAPTCAPILRLKYSRTSGTGTLTAKIFAKGA